MKLAFYQGAGTGLVASTGLAAGWLWAPYITQVLLIIGLSLWLIVLVRSLRK